MSVWLTSGRQTLVVVLLLLGGWIGLQPVHAQNNADSIRAFLQGRITVSPEVDSTQQYDGFEVLVARRTEGGIDTLGVATTDVRGQFAMDIQAPTRQLYPLVISRRGEALLSANYVVAPGDSATMNVQLPHGNRPLQIRSSENSAWLAYQNTLALYRQSLVQALQTDSTMTRSMDQSIEQAVSILWGMPNSYPNTLGAAYARAETITLLEGWNDSLAVVRAREVGPTNPRYVEVARAARRAQARIAGHEASIALLNRFRRHARTDRQRAALQAEVVRAHIDNRQQEAALTAARELAGAYPNTSWADWAERAAYEVQNLMPGMEAPEFSVTTWTGESLDLADLRGRPVVLEFYEPSNELYQKQLSTRKALYDGTRSTNLALVSISLQPDSLLNEAFFDGRDLPGMHVVAPEDVAQGFVETYNLGSLPTRFLIDERGRIINKYVGSGFSALQDAVVRRFSADASAR